LIIDTDYLGTAFGDVANFMEKIGTHPVLFMHNRKIFDNDNWHVNTRSKMDVSLLFFYYFCKAKECIKKL
jgi:hypothetical protein